MRWTGLTSTWLRSSPKAKRELRLLVQLAGGSGANIQSSNFTDVFKTPGKMRGKTPRTARKRNVEDDRVVSCVVLCACGIFSK